MIRIQQMKLKPGHAAEALEEKAAKVLRVPPEQIASCHVVKQSIDARKKPEIWFSYVVDVKLKSGSEETIVRRCRDNNISCVTPASYRFPEPGKETGTHRPLIVGMGPAGLFCGYMLAKAGYRPILLERGKDVQSRVKDVETFWAGGPCLPDSNVQFGEGGAGTFSDGKLNTLIKDKEGRGGEVLRILVEHGAPSCILYENKPHIGTDILAEVVKNMREQILAWGGEVHFNTRVEQLLADNGTVTGVKCAGSREFLSGTVVLAVGHSARDTFEMLEQKNIPMEAKAFAVGLRVEHPQSLINFSQYASEWPEYLPPASYKLTARTGEGRGVYSFCMCPGGYVVNAGSEEGRLAVNGMSYSRRDGKNANSAIIVTVTPEDYEAYFGDCRGPLAGIAFARALEEKAWMLGGGRIPVQRYGEFAGKPEGRKAQRVPSDFLPCIKGQYTFADLRSLLPDSIRKAFIEGMEAFDRIIPGFADDAVCLAGVESRTSSPVRIHRQEDFQSEVKGLYPCGEGAGYAGGITSAAIDGMKIAEAIAKRFKII
nr:FAD-dependent oxidoreductase [uncultured Eisenbergiella sp.]